ncbi:MAG: TrbG/VirB9 family P-type conjugative transfer protein [Holosporales bacterium]|jgi:type IV secretory pathway VirB9-like protein
MKGLLPLIVGLFLASHAQAQIGLAPPLGNPNTVQGGGQPDFIQQTQQDIQQQSQGNYPDMVRDLTPLGAIQQSWNNPVPSSGQISPGIVRYVWRPDYVMAIRTREFMQTTIELPQWESISEIILGDRTVFEAQKLGKDYMLAIRPTHPGADTNMTVIGSSGNIYNFYLRSEGWNSKNITDFTVFVLANPANAGASNSIGAVPHAPGAGTPINALTGQPFVNQPMSGLTGTPSGTAFTGNTAPTTPEFVRSIAFDPTNLRFDLKIYAPTPADVEIAPLRAFTDGLWTYFDYGEKADTVRRPVVFRVVDGVDSMVNTRTMGPRGNIIVAEAIGNFTLRNGDRVVCVYQAGAPRTFEGNRSMPPPVPSNDPSLFFNNRLDGAADNGLGPQYSGSPIGGVNRQPNFANGNGGAIGGNSVPAVAGPIAAQGIANYQNSPIVPLQPAPQPGSYSQAYGGVANNISIAGPASVGGPQLYSNLPSPTQTLPPGYTRPQSIYNNNSITTVPATTGIGFGQRPPLPSIPVLPSSGARTYEPSQPPSPAALQQGWIK